MLRLAHCLLLALLLGVHAARAEAYLAYTVPVPPWTFPATPERGVASEYLRYLFDTADIPLRIDTMPYLRVINGLRDGSNTAALLIPDAERDTFAIRLCEVATIHSGVLYKRARYGELSIERMSGLTVGVQRGTRALDRLKKVPGVKPHAVDSVVRGLKMLELDRLDATFLSSPGSEIMLAEAGLKQADYAWLEIDVQPVVVYVSRRAALAQDPAALLRLRKVCAGSGKPVMQDLLRRYH